MQTTTHTKRRSEVAPDNRPGILGVRPTSLGLYIGPHSLDGRECTITPGEHRLAGALPKFS